MGYAVVSQIYNERRLFYGGGPGIVPNDTFGSVGSSPNSDRRGPRSRGMSFLLVFKMAPMLSFQHYILQEIYNNGK